MTGYSRSDLSVTFNDSTLFIHTVSYRESSEPYADGAVMGAEQGWQTDGGGVVASGSPTNTWTTLSGVTLSTGAWHRVTVEKDYAASKYRLYRDGNPSAVNNPTISGDWFNMVSTANNFLSFARVLGASADAPGYAADLVVDTLQPGFFPPSPTVFRFR